MSEKKYNKNSLQGTVYVLLSAICFSLGGVLIKSISVEFVVDQHGAKRFIIYSDICLSENTGEKVCF